MTWMFAILLVGTYIWFTRFITMALIERWVRGY